MTYVPDLRESSAGWLGQGQLVYSTQKKPNTPLTDNSSLQQLQTPYIEAQNQRRASQAAYKAARQASRQGHVTVYDATKRQYVSATPAEAISIRDANNGIQAQRRAAQQSRALGRGNVTIFDASKGSYVSATTAEAKLIEQANKRIAMNTGLNEKITSHMGNTSYYGGKTVKSGDKFISVSAQQVEAQAQRRLGQAAEHTAKQASKKGHVTVFDASKGLYVSATPEEAKLIQAANPTKKSKGFLGSVKGFFGKTKDFFGKAKKSFSGGFSKFKSFLKTPKGKWGLVIAAIAVVAGGLYAYVSNRFSSKYNPEPTDGPSKIIMPKLKNETEETDEPEIITEVIPAEETTETKKAEETVVTPAPSEETKPEETKPEETTNNTTTPATETEKKEAEEIIKANDVENKREPAIVSGDEYEVIEGDCVWNIAKANLKELNKDKPDYVPSNVDILRRTKELMEINDLHFEQDNYVVIIQPGQKIKLKK